MRDFQGLHAALVPTREQGLAVYLPVLRRDIGHLDYYLRDQSQGMARIQKGEVPDGSGTPIVDAGPISDIYLVLLGRPGNQVAHGGKSPLGTLTLSSTLHPTKGFIYLGEGLHSSFDETNDRLGLGTAVPTAKVHISVAPPSFVTTVRPQGDSSVAGWVNTTGGTPVAPDLGGTTTATFARGVEGGAFGSYIASATGTAPGTFSGWNVLFSARVTTGPPGVCFIAINMDSGGGSWFNSGNQNLTTGAFQDFTFPVVSASATAAVFSNLRWGLSFAASPGFGEVQVGELRLQLPASGGVANDILQKWDAGTSSARLDFGDSGASTVDMQLSGNTPWFTSLGDNSSGLRIYTSASTAFVEAGTTAQAAMNLTLGGNRQSVATLIRLNAATASANIFEASRIGIGGIPSSSPLIHLDVTGSTRFVANSPAIITATVTTLTLGDGTFVRQGAGTPGSWVVKSITGGTDGRMLFITNPSSFEWVIDHESSGGSAANKIHSNAQVAHRMAPDDGVFLFYDATLSRWRLFEWLSANGTYTILGAFTWNSTLLIDEENSGLLVIQANVGGAGGPLIEFLDTGTGNTLLLQATTLSGSSTLALPDATDTLVARNTTDTLTNKTLGVSCKLHADTLLSGVALVDVNDNTKLFRVIVSGSATGVRNAIQFSNTIAQIYHFMIDLGGIIPLVGDDDPGVQAGNLGKIDKIGQTANIGTTNLSNGPPVGFYEVEVVLMCTTSAVGAGTLAVVIGWTDNVGATTNTVITGFVLTATGRTTGRALLRLASGDITYAVTVTGIYSTAVYAVYVRVIALG